MANSPTQYFLDAKRMPTHWYNIAADLPVPLPPVLHPGTLKPIGPSDLAPLFPMELIAQEVSTERQIPIPEPVREVYCLWRPTPLHRAHRLEKALGTPAKIYYKYEGVSPAGSHKPNTAVPQAWYNAQAGIKKLATETGAGQWGSALAFAGALFGIDVSVFQVRVSYDQKPYRRALIETYGARCIASPSMETNAGRAALAKQPDHPGSLGLAISEAVEVAATHDDTKYALGSVLNHVLLHQTIIGQEAMLQMEMAGDDPDVIVGCTGGGSNFSGLAFPFLGQQLRGGKKRRIIAVEPAACPSLTRGKYAYDFGDTAHLTPLVKMHTLGSTFTPPGFHAGGLRYHGMAPLVSHLKQLKLLDAVAYDQVACFEAGVQFARAEGIVPAPEANHAVKGAIAEA
ncbi:MAG TPA: TrpB-like pyridoxal phosphate-dependent enzyme [Burkholderiaceae bacterium]|nr:TrpB-like pyridoxal phosphate-dependent enzyme [Burkholderiaceae bacterium]